MQLNPSEISELLKGKIQGLNLVADTRNQGTVVSVTDGICRIHGISNVMQGEMLEFPNNTIGLALNLERDSVGAVVLGEYTEISEGDVVKATGRILDVPVGPELIGRVVNALGQPIDGKGACERQDDGCHREGGTRGDLPKISLPTSPDRSEGRRLHGASRSWSA